MEDGQLFDGGLLLSKPQEHSTRLQPKRPLAGGLAGYRIPIKLRVALELASEGVRQKERKDLPAQGQAVGQRYQQDFRGS